MSDLMTKRNLWREIEILIECSGLTKIDQESLFNLIKEWGVKNE